MNVTKRIKLDFARSLNPVVVWVKQGDENSRFIEIVPLKNGDSYTIPSGVSIKFACKKPDGHQVLNDYPTISNNIITVPLSDQTLAAAGEGLASIILFDDVNQKILSTQNFILYIEQNPLVGSEVESSDEYQSYLAALLKIGDLPEITQEAEGKVIGIKDGEYAFVNAATGSGIHIGADEPTDGSEVWIDTDEEAPESDGGGASIDVTAEVGQTIIVKAVDANGKPTEWESADYQPKTHWSELVELLPETNAVIDESEGMFVIPVNFVFKVGETYKIKYNGDEYVRTAFGFTAEGVTVAIVGNGVSLGLDDTGEPFTIFVQDGVLVVMFLDGSAEGTVAIYGNEYHTIPRKYLPETVHWIDAVEVNGTYEQITVTPAQTSAAISAGLTIMLRISTFDSASSSNHIYYLPCVTRVVHPEHPAIAFLLVFFGKVGTYPQDRTVHLGWDLTNGSENVNEISNLPWVVSAD